MYLLYSPRMYVISHAYVIKTRSHVAIRVPEIKGSRRDSSFAILRHRLRLIENAPHSHTDTPAERYLAQRERQIRG